MKRASYRDAVNHIAFNDDPSCVDAVEVRGTLTVGLIASIFGVTNERVASDVVRLRVSHPREVCPYIEPCTACQPRKVRKG